MYNYLKWLTLFLFLVPGLGWVSGFAASPASVQQQENVFLHQDRDIYVAGERVFFKMQVIAAESPQSTSSRIAYLVLRNAQSSNVMQLSVQLSDQGAWSAFVLPDTLSSGHYELVAFTNLMRNQGEQSFFRKQLFVANRFDSEIQLIESFHQGFESRPTSFYPEGGRLIEGMPSKVAVLAGDAGNFSSEALWLTDHHGDTLQQLVFEDADIGVFHLKPQAGNSYFLLLADGRRIALPLIHQQGCGISISPQQGNLEVELHPSFGQESSFSLTVNGVGGVVGQRSLNLHDQPLRMYYSAEELPYGMLDFVLQNDQGEVVCRRLWYHQPAQQASVSISFPALQPVARQQVPFKIMSQGMDGLPLSVAVVQRDVVYDHQKSIINHLLLRSNTLADYQRLAQRAAGGSMQVGFNDLLMAAVITEDYASEVHQQEPSFGYVQEVQGFSLSGQLIDVGNGEGIAGATIYLSSPDTLLNFNYAITLQDGSFHFLLDEYYHGRELILQTADEALQETSRISIHDRFALEQPFRPVVPADINDHLEAIVRLQKVVSVQKHYGVCHQAVSHSSGLPVMVPQPLFHAANQVVIPSEYVALDDFREIAREIIYPLRIRIEGDGSYSAALVNDRNRSYFQGAPLFFLDAVPVADISQIMDLSSDDLVRIDVHNIPWIYGDLSFDGIVSLVSKQKHRELQFPSSAARTSAPSFIPRLVLEDKSCETMNPQEVVSPDFRTLLGWRAAIIPDRQPAELSFVCSDLKGDYLIVVKGIDQFGTPVGGIFNFNIQ